LIVLVGLYVGYPRLDSLTPINNIAQEKFRPAVAQERSMLSVLGNRTYRHLFLAQIVALIGTGLATVALGLLAYDLAGAEAGTVLGTALAIKMLAYIGVAPIAAAFAERLPRRATLVTLDLIRGAVALCLPFVSQIWQIYILIFVLQSASAAFTPTFQATIPDILPEEEDYTRALSLIASCLRSRKCCESDVGGRTAVRHQFSYAVCRNFHWFPPVGRAGCLGGLAQSSHA